MDGTMRLVLLRHGESVWNKENLFTGWTDVDLSETGRGEASCAGRIMRSEGLDFDVCYTSYLKRAIHTLYLALEEMDREWLPTVKAWQLNERHYGALQGLNKSETAARYGEDQVKVWRRSYAVRPPALDPSDERNPALLEMYRGVPRGSLPLTECLADTVARAVPYFESEIRPRMLAGDRVLIVAHGNSLRALVKVFEGMSDDEIVGVNIPTGVPLVYEFDGDFNVVSKRYLGDQEALSAKMDAVANQGKARRARSRLPGACGWNTCSNPLLPWATVQNAVLMARSFWAMSGTRASATGVVSPVPSGSSPHCPGDGMSCHSAGGSDSRTLCHGPAYGASGFYQNSCICLHNPLYCTV